MLVVAMLQRVLPRLAARRILVRVAAWRGRALVRLLVLVGELLARLARRRVAILLRALLIRLVLLGVRRLLLAHEILLSLNEAQRKPRPLSASSAENALSFYTLAAL